MRTQREKIFIKNLLPLNAGLAVFMDAAWICCLSLRINNVNHIDLAPVRSLLISHRLTDIAPVNPWSPFLEPEKQRSFLTIW